jgi:hypothetical protein
MKLMTRPRYNKQLLNYAESEDDEPGMHGAKGQGAQQ